MQPTSIAKVNLAQQRAERRDREKGRVPVPTIALYFALSALLARQLRQTYIVHALLAQRCTPFGFSQSGGLIVLALTEVTAVPFRVSDIRAALFFRIQI